MFKMAEDFGLKLLKGGNLIDTTLGDPLPLGDGLGVRVRVGLGVAPGSAMGPARWTMSAWSRTQRR